MGNHSGQQQWPSGDPNGPHYNTNDVGNHQYAADVKQQAIQQVEKQYGINSNDKNFWTLVEKAMASIQGTVQAQQQINQQQQQLASDVGTRQAPSIGNNNYMSIPHDQLYNMVNTNLSASQVGDGGRAWNTISNKLVSISQTLSQASAATESSWTGSAADAARAFHGGVATWTGSTSESAQLASDTMYNQSQAAATVKNAVPKPVQYSFWDEVKDFMTAPDPASGMNAINGKLAAQQQAHQQAAQAVQTYDTSLGQSAAKMPSIASPPAFNPNSGGKGTGTGTGSGSGAGGSGGGGYVPPGGPGGGGSGGAGAGSGGSGGSGGGGYHPPNWNGGGGSGSGSGGGSGVGGSGGPGGLNNGLPPGTTTDPSWSNPGSTYPGGGGMNPGGAGGPGGGSGDMTGMPMGGMPMGGGGLGGLGADSFRGGPGGGGGGGFGGSGAGGAGSGSGSGLGGRPGSGFGPGGTNDSNSASSGARSGAGAAAAEEAALGRGVAGARGAAGAGGAGGPMGGGRGQKGKDDEEHKRASFLVESDPDSIFGTDERTAPPVIGG